MKDIWDNIGCVIGVPEEEERESWTEEILEEKMDDYPKGDEIHLPTDSRSSVNLK